MSGYRPYRPLRGAYFTGLSAILIHNRVKDLDIDKAGKGLPPEQRERLRHSLMDLAAAAEDAWQRISENRGNAEVAESASDAALEAAPEDPKRIPAWEAAKLLNVTERRVTGLAVSGQLDGIKVRKKWMITLSSVEDYRLAKDVA